jgi:cation diffusion facilitator CzcD-associated flavoprotein CzcO
MMAASKQSTGPDHREASKRFDAVVIGVGFGGMYALHKLREMGLKVGAIEAGGDVGGVWYWNRYPGARCDVMSLDYSYSFSNEIMQEWTWSEQFAAQPEILAYANYVATKLDLRRDIQFNTRARTVSYHDAGRHWVIETRAGEVFETTYLLMATGPLSIPKPLDTPGVDTFAGEIYQAQRWPHEDVDLSGKRIGVIGTGSTGIQIIPVVAEVAAHLHVFQRTPSFSLPMRNRKLEPEYIAQIKAHYPELRAIARATFTGGVRPVSTRPLFSVTAAERQALMEEAWKTSGLAFLGLFSDLLVNQEANDIVADFVRDKISEVVRNPDTAERLKPRGYPIFARRPCLDTNYYETYNRPNVTLIDCLTDPIEQIMPTGVRTRDREIALDVIIAATGYDGLTGAMLALDVKGRNGASLRDKWNAGAKSHLGLMMQGFPNLFIVAGANGPSALANFILLNEQNVEWASECITYMRENNIATIEPTREAEDGWMDQIAQLSGRSLMPKANTWYTGTNIKGKPRSFSIYMGGLQRYRETCSAAALRGYEGFSIEHLDIRESPALESIV